MTKGYDVTKEHRQQGCVSPIEMRVDMYKQMMANDNKWRKVINAIAELNERGTVNANGNNQ